MSSKAFTLSQSTVEGATCPPGRKDALFFDQKLRGFGLRVTRHGGKVFIAQYRAGGKVRRVVIGAFGAVTPAEARNRAKVYLGAAADGRDLDAEKKAKVVATKQQAIDDTFSFDALVKAWAKARATDRRPSYLDEAVKCCNRNLAAWKDRPATSISVREAVALLDEIKAEKGTVTANRTLAYARAAYSWALKRQMIDKNPFMGIERPGRETTRERVLSAAELRAIWAACQTLSPLMRAYVCTLMLTLQRREEVAGMQWTELDEDQTAWNLPGQRAKNGRTTIVHLSGPVRELLSAMPKIDGNPYVFAGEKKGQSVRGFNSAKVQIDEALVTAGHALSPWCFHDFRRAGVTALAGLGHAPHVCDRILNHITGSIQGVAAIYQRFQFLDEREAALDEWAKHVTTAGVPAKSPVASELAA